MIKKQSEVWFHTRCDLVLFPWGTSPRCFPEVWDQLHYAANIFGQGTTKERAKACDCLIQRPTRQGITSLSLGRCFLVVEYKVAAKSTGQHVLRAWESHICSYGVTSSFQPVFLLPSAPRTNVRITEKLGRIEVAWLQQFMRHFKQTLCLRILYHVGNLKQLKYG